MRTRILTLSVVALLVVHLASAPALAAAEARKQLTLGILAFRPKTEMRFLWKPVIAGLNRSLPGYVISFDVLTYQEMESALRQHRLDFVLTNPAHYVEIRHRYSMTGVLATLVEQQGPYALSAFGGTIIARNDRTDLTTLEDLRGRTIATVGKNSLGGYQAQVFEMLRAGIAAPKEERLIIAGMPHDLVVEAILSGKADAGFVRSGLIEQMAAGGKLERGRIKIINPQDVASFPYALSTQLYPEWPFIALSHVDEELAAQVASALLGIKHQTGTAKGYEIHGFTVPADYSAVEKLLRELRMPPFDATPAFTPGDVWRRYRITIIAMVLAAGAIAALSVFLLLLNRRLRTEQQNVRESEAKYRFFVESANDAVMIHSIQPTGRPGPFFLVNELACEWFGYTREEFARLTPQELNDPLHLGHIPLVMEKLQKEGRAVFETVMVRKDGGRVPVEISTRLLEIGGFPYILSLVRDITERKRAIEALTKWEHIFRYAQWGIAVGSGDGEVFELMNPTFAAMHGYAVEELRGQPLISIFAPECRATLSDQIRTAYEKGHSIWETTDIRKDGSTFPVLIDVTVIYDDRGEAQYRVMNVQDITERKAAEERIRQLVKEQQIILNTIPLGVAYVKERRLIWVSAAFERMFGYEAEEARDLDARRLYARGEDYERVGREGYRQITAGKVYATEALSARKDGSLFWLSLTGRAVNPEDPASGSIWMMQDITERKAAEEALLESERLFRESIESLPMPIGIANTDGTIRRYNKSFVETYGYTLQDIPTIDAWMSTAYPDPAYRERSRLLWESDVRKAIADGGSTTTREYEVLCRNGRVKNVEITMRPIGSLFIAAFYDVTARRHVEKDLMEKRLQLEDLTRNLERRVQEEIALRTRNEEMLVQQSKLAAMGEMLGAIAHQWRQPLNALGLIIQNLRDANAHDELDGAFLDRTVEKSMAQLRHMSKTIDDFRNFFQPEKERTTFDAMQAVGEVLTLFAAQLAANDIDVRMVCKAHQKVFTKVEDIIPCPEKTVTGFRNEFEHVIMNLINNSREAILEQRETGRMGGRDRGLLAFEFCEGDGSVRIEVSDNGGGIAAEVLGRVFEPYFTTKGPEKGTGVGLYMSKVIIEEHMQGKLAVRNEAGGAVFTIDLPRS